jgi:hypothetical protein
MTTVLPHGESLRRAIAWISERRELAPDQPALPLVEEACLRFDLSPNEEEWLLHMLTKKTPAPND